MPDYRLCPMIMVDVKCKALVFPFAGPKVMFATRENIICDVMQGIFLRYQSGHFCSWWVKVLYEVRPVVRK